MSRINLMGGSFAARSPVSAAQRCLNLYTEPVPQEAGEPAGMAHYATPGSRILTTLPTSPIRGIRQASNGNTYVVAGSVVYLLDSNWNPTALGSITPGLTTPVSMTDNSLTLVIVDGTTGGWTVNLGDNAFAAIADVTGSFRGADRVDYLDTFLLFNVPGTPQFQASNSLAVTFDPLYFANKSGYPDLLVTLIVAKREIWLLGTRTSEPWYNTGAADFPFERMQGAFVDHGCAAKYSVVEIDNSVFWLSQDRQGQAIVLQASGYNAKRISTYPIETAIGGYARISDAEAWSYQLQGHSCYVLSFPTASKTWVWDVSTEQWHEWCWLDGNGAEQRHRGRCGTLCNGVIAVGDWQNGNLYALDPAVFQDFGGPIKRLRTFAHLEGKDGHRVAYSAFYANTSVGNMAGTTDATEPLIYLSWSDDRGQSFGNPVASGLGAAGEYRTQPQWNRTGMARSRVFSLEWNANADIALLGAWVDAKPASS